MNCYALADMCCCVISVVRCMPGVLLFPRTFSSASFPALVYAPLSPRDTMHASSVSTSLTPACDIVLYAATRMFEVLILTGLGYTPSSGSWTRNLLPDGWKNGSGGNSQ